MANIFTSSIGKKLIMSISGLFLVLFLFIHAFVNCLSLISPEAFDAGCDFMALPIVTVMVPVLAFGFIIHIVYAFVLNLMNYRARGTERYAVSNKAKTDDWAAKNMLVLGIIVLGFLTSGQRCSYLSLLAVRQKMARCFFTKHSSLFGW